MDPTFQIREDKKHLDKHKGDAELLQMQGMASIQSQYPY